MWTGTCLRQPLRATLPAAKRAGGRGVILGPSRFFPAAWAKKARRTTRLPGRGTEEATVGIASTQGRLARRMLGLRVTVIETKSSPGHKRRIHPGATKVSGTFHGTFASPASDVASRSRQKQLACFLTRAPTPAAARVSSVCRSVCVKNIPPAPRSIAAASPQLHFFGLCRGAR